MPEMTTDPEGDFSIDPETGQQRQYLVASLEAREGVRDRYIHLSCGTITTMPPQIAQTLEDHPEFYHSMFCHHCKEHRPLTEFVWVGTWELLCSKWKPWE